MRITNLWYRSLHRPFALKIFLFVNVCDLYKIGLAVIVEIVNTLIETSEQYIRFFVKHSINNFVSKLY